MNLRLLLIAVFFISGIFTRELPAADDPFSQPQYIDSLRAYINQSIADSAFPGAAIAVSHQGKTVLMEGFGHFTYDSASARVTPQSIFDLASVTKVVATTTLAMMLYDYGLLNLDQPVAEIVPDFTGAGKEKVTIRHLLTHTSGLPGWIKFYLETSGKDTIVTRICRTPLEYETGTKTIYSDLGMILMQRIIETLSGKPQDMLFHERIATPLQMDNSFYNPDNKYLDRIVPTEVSEFHHKLIQGFVHDENTFVMGGVSGHAGLFSTAADLDRFCRMYLSGGSYNGIQLLKPETIDYFTRPQNLVAASTRALGWDTRSQEGSSSGQYLSMRAFGHTGFTGTSVWIDPVKHVSVVFLTNRVHPTRENRQISRVRPVVHDLVMKALFNIGLEDE